MGERPYLGSTSIARAENAGRAIGPEGPLGSGPDVPGPRGAGNRASEPVSRPGPRLAGPDAGKTCGGVGGGYRSCPGPGRRYFDRRGCSLLRVAVPVPLDPGSAIPVQPRSEVRNRPGATARLFRGIPARRRAFAVQYFRYTCHGARFHRHPCLVGLFWTTSAMFGGINRAFRRAWRNDPTGISWWRGCVTSEWR